MGNMRDALMSLKPKTPWYWKNTDTPTKEAWLTEWSEKGIGTPILGFVYDQMKRDVESDEGMTVEQWVQDYVVDKRGNLGQGGGGQYSDSDLRSRILADYADSFMATSLNQTQQIEQIVAQMANSIKHMESRGDYTAQGATGEFGAYQFMPETWAANAGTILGNRNAPMTQQNQDAVAQGMIAKWKAEEYSPEQIFAMWNAGPGRPEAWDPNKVWDFNGQQITGWAATNSSGVAFDTPAYVRGALNHMNGYS